MQSLIANVLALVLLAALGYDAGAAHATTAAQTCQAGKNKLVGKYAACRHGAEAKLATTGDITKYVAAIDKCTGKYSAVWQKLEIKAGGACPTNDDDLDIAEVVSGNTLNIANALGGGVLSHCSTELPQCSADLATCQAAVSGPHGKILATGVTVCSDASGAAIPCAGSGQDGELQEGLARSYTDNGDGTITDNRTGLMWEKLSNDGSIHDMNGPVFGKIATLNTGSGFASYRDWRLPNANELQSLVNYGAANPAVDAAFNTACIAGCTVATCSCTSVAQYQSSTQIWSVDFQDGTVRGFNGGGRIRAVRGG